MDFPKNTTTTSSNEVTLILEDVIKQIEKHPTSNVVAYIKSYKNYDMLPCSTHYRNQVFYHKDAIREAIKTIIDNGWYVWECTDYEDVLDIWVTRTDVRPHSWFKKTII